MVAPTSIAVIACAVSCFVEAQEATRPKTNERKDGGSGILGIHAVPVGEKHMLVFDARGGHAAIDSVIVLDWADALRPADLGIPAMLASVALERNGQDLLIIANEPVRAWRVSVRDDLSDAPSEVEIPLVGIAVFRSVLGYDGSILLSATLADGFDRVTAARN